MEFNLTRDLPFKKVMTDPDNNELLKAFIQDILNIEVESVTTENVDFISINKENIPQNVDGSVLSLFHTQVDILAKLKSGEQVIIEMQSYSETYFRERLFKYICDAYSSLYSKTDKYLTLKPVYSIAIINARPKRFDNIAKRVGEIRFRETDEIFTYREDDKDLLLIAEFYLKADPESEKIKMWQDFFLYGKIQESSPKYLVDAIDKLNKLSKEEKAMFTTFEERIEDAQGVMMLKEAKDKAEGREEERKRAILSLLEIGLEDSILIRAGYTLEEIQKAKAKLNNLTQ